MMSSLAGFAPGSSVAGRLVAGQRKVFGVPESLHRWTSRDAALIQQPCRQLKSQHQNASPLRVAEAVGPTSEERKSEERFLDVRALLSEFNPLTESHLLVWEDSDDEDGAVQIELPQAGAWEDSSSGYQGLEHQPSWIDYRDGSESDDADTSRGAAGAYGTLAAVMPELGNEGDLSSNPAAAAAAAPPHAYSPEAGFQEVSVFELEERLATGQFSLLLDVRSRPEHDSGHIAGAVNLPLDPDLSAAVRSGSLDEFRDRPVAVVCGSGMRSGQATVRLSKVYGFANVTNVAGGMAAWVQGGLPVQSHQHRAGGCGCGGGGGGGCKSKQAM